ncbi:MAG: aldo/keto reductase [Spirochaetota bacterium]
MTRSNFGLGCWSYGSAEPGSDAERTAVRVIRAAYEQGVRHFDTAQDYGDGRSEEIVGPALEGKADAELATKSRLVPAAETASVVRTSLSRLRRETVDLFYIHWPRTGVDFRPMLEALETERSRGTIKRIGVSNFSAEQLERASEVARIGVHQVGYSLLWRYPEREVVPYCRAHGIETYSYSSLAQGLLTGKMPRLPSFAPGDPRPNTVFYQDDVWPHVHEGLTRMTEVAREAGASLHHLALRWLVDRAGAARVLVGAKSEPQLADNLAAFGSEALPQALEELERISDEVHEHIPDVGNIFQYYP